MPYPTKDQLERAKLSLEMVVYVVVISVVILLLWRGDYFAGKIGQAINRAGLKVEEVNLWLIKLKVSSDTLSTAQATLADYKALIACTHRRNCTPAQVTSVESLVGGISNPQTATVEREINEAIQQTEQLVQTAEERIARDQPALRDVIAQRTAAGGWIALIGADRTLPAAQDEVDRVKSSFPRTDILFADGWYRTVVRFDSEADARAASSQIRSLTKREPYVREFNLWCPGAVAQPGFTRCGSRQADNRSR
jgi:hypothetical protein